MAAAKSLDRESLTCPVCLDLLSDPVTIPCGHSFCRTCIGNSWPEAGNAPLQCPQCRKRFVSRPDLNKNIMLADLVEQIRNEDPRSDLYAGPRDVPCDVCPHQKLKAVKSCLHCVVSYCEIHLRPHRHVPMLRKHQLVAPTDKLQDNICPEHNEVKKMFCHLEQAPVCRLCCGDQHRGHDTVSSEDERAQKQAELEAQVDLLKSKVMGKKQEQQKLAKRKQDTSDSALSVEIFCNSTFTEIENLLRNIRAGVLQYINSQLNIEQNKNNLINHKLQQEISTLTETISDLEELAGTQDHNHFLLLYAAAPSSPGTPTGPEATGTPTGPEATGSQREVPQPGNAQPMISESAPQLPGNIQLTASQSGATQPTETQELDLTSFLASPPFCLNNVVISMTHLRERFQHSLGNFNPGPELPLAAPQPVTRDDLLSYRQELKLDPKTASRLLTVVYDNRKVIYVNRNVSQQNDFSYAQVMSNHGMVFRSYWEVDVSQAKYVCIAVTHKGSEQPFGNNDISWSLKCDNKRFSFSFNSWQTDVVGPVRPRIGVYLDPRAGLLSFYSVSNESVTLLHKVQTRFNRTLYAGLALGYHGDRVGFADMGPPFYTILD